MEGGRRRREERLAGRQKAQMIDLEVDMIMEPKRLKIHCSSELFQTLPDRVAHKKAKMGY